MPFQVVERNAAANWRACGLRPLRSALTTSVVVFLAGCAGSQAFSDGNRLLSEGKTNEGMAKLEQALRDEPQNAEYRIALTKQRTAMVDRLLAAGDAARRAGRLGDAQQVYGQVQAIDPSNVMAKQGLDAIATEMRHRAIVGAAESRLSKGGAENIAAAEESLRSVLAENPQQKDALEVKRLVDQAKGKAAVPEAALGPAFSKPITLEFRDAPLRSVFDFIAKISGLNIFFDKDVKTDQKVSVMARDTSIEDAVRLLLLTNQLERKILSDNSILVYPNTPPKQKEYQTLSVRAFYLTNADVKAVSNTIKTLVKTKDIVMDERLGMLILRDTPEAIRMAERIVALQDLGDSEVLLEVEVLEVKRSRLVTLGIQWPNQLALSPLPLAANGTVVTLAQLQHLTPATTQAQIGSLVFNANAVDDDANILANPRIRVRNKEKAKVLIGDKVPVVTTTSTSTGFVSDSVTYVDVGLKLEVEPTIYLDEDVAIKINLEVSSIVNQTVLKDGSIIYQIGTRQATTVLRLKDGENQILAGLISDQEEVTVNKVPGLGDLPVAGKLFGSRNDNGQRGEILLSITPHVVRSIRRLALLDAEFPVGTEANVGAPALRLRGATGPGGVAPTMRAAVSAAPAASNPGGVDPSVPAPALRSTPAEGIAPSMSSSAAPPADAAPAAAPTGPATLGWQVPPQVRAGDQFDASLLLRSSSPLGGVPLTVGYDTNLLQLVSVTEGSYFLQGGGGQSAFSFRADEGAGQVAIEDGRDSGNINDPGVSGTGTIAVLRFLALKTNNASPAATSPSALRVLSLGVQPATASPPALPPDQPLRIMP